MCECMSVCECVNEGVCECKFLCECVCQETTGLLTIAVLVSPVSPSVVSLRLV